MWSIFFVLPNLGLKNQFGNDNIAIVPHNDSRVTNITSSNPFAKSLFKGFEDQFRRKAYPSALLVNINSSDRIREPETIVGFRNSFALSTIIKGHEHSLTSSFVAYPLYSDYFDFYPISISRQNDGLITNSPAGMDYNDESKKFRGQTSPSLLAPGQFFAEPDSNLFDSLQKAWHRRFIKKRTKEWSTRALFRSLEMAYQASTLPFENHSTIYDYGVSASLWVSALEILSHPRRGQANLLSVIELLGHYQWNNRVLKKKTYKVKYRGREHKVNLPQKLYKELYDTRNDFLHGEPVKINRLFPFKNNKLPGITRFAPLIYKVALLSFLKQFNKQERANDITNIARRIVNEQNFAEAFLKAKKK